MPVVSLFHWCLKCVHLLFMIESLWPQHCINSSTSKRFAINVNTQAAGTFCSENFFPKYTSLFQLKIRSFMGKVWALVAVRNLHLSVRRLQLLACNVFNPWQHFWYFTHYILFITVLLPIQRYFRLDWVHSTTTDYYRYLGFNRIPIVQIK